MKYRFIFEDISLICYMENKFMWKLYSLFYTMFSSKIYSHVYVGLKLTFLWKVLGKACTSACTSNGIQKPKLMQRTIKNYVLKVTKSGLTS
jgi:hypothetical protein